MQHSQRTKSGPMFKNSLNKTTIKERIEKSRLATVSQCTRGIHLSMDIL